MDTSKVTVQLTSRTVPAGIDLRVTPQTFSGAPVGQVGTPSATPVSITGTGVPVISGIGSGYTGDGTSNGSELIYSLNVDDWTTVEPGTVTGLEITYTLTD